MPMVRNRKRSWFDHLEDRLEKSFLAKTVALVILAGVFVWLVDWGLRVPVFHQSTETSQVIAVEKDGKLVPYDRAMENGPYAVVPVK